MDDLISRQQAIDRLTEYGNGRAVFISVGEAIIRIEQLPPAQPERIKGHWVNGRCDKCNAHAPFWCMASTYHESNFCPNCGAKMEVTE